jgi:hypothetical protein
LNEVNRISKHNPNSGGSNSKLDENDKLRSFKSYIILMLNILDKEENDYVNKIKKQKIVGFFSTFPLKPDELKRLPCINYFLSNGIITYLCSAASVDTPSGFIEIFIMLLIQFAERFKTFEFTT